MSMWYDKQGNVITMDEAAPLLNDLTYKRVGYGVVGPFRVSTVWLGLNHSFSSDSPPLIFETMVFRRSSYSDVYCARYPTEALARKGHDEVVTGITSGRIHLTHNRFRRPLDRLLIWAFPYKESE